MELNFGRYKGQIIEQVFQKDPSYCKWLSNQEMLLDNKPEIKEYLEKQLQTADFSYKMRWGRHKNLTINRIKEIDPDYIEWLKNNDFVQKSCPKLLSELDALT